MHADIVVIRISLGQWRCTLFCTLVINADTHRKLLKQKPRFEILFICEILGMKILKRKPTEKLDVTHIIKHTQQYYIIITHNLSPTAADI